MTVVGLAWPHPDPLTDGILDSIEQTAVELGLTVRRVTSPDEERSVDMLVLVGYPRTYETFLEAPRRARRIAWFGEPLPRPGSAGAASADGGRLGAIGLRAARRFVAPVVRRALPGRAGRARERLAIAHERSANLADARWCARLVDQVVVTSRDRGAVLHEQGVEARVVPFGYHPAGAGPLVGVDDGGRDIAIAVIGSDLGSTRLRRGRVLAKLAPALATVGEVVHLQGVWGSARDAMLRRTRVVLDIHRVPGNFTGLRFLPAFAAGAVLVTEPLDDPFPFEPGGDHVEAPLDRIVGATAALLGDEPGRVTLARRAQARLVGDLSMRSSLGRVLAA